MSQKTPIVPATIVILQPKLPSYRWPFFDQLAQEWPGRIHVVHGDDRPVGPLASLPNDERVGHFSVSKVPWSHSFGRWHLSVPAVLKAFRTAKPDLVMVHGDLGEPAVHLLLAWAHWLRGIPVICMGQYRRAGARPLITAFKPRWHRFFQGLVLYNEQEYQRYCTTYNFNRIKTTYLNNGLEQYPLPPTSAHLESRRLNGPFMCLGRLEPKNRFDLAVRAYILYRQLGGRRKLLIIGDGSSRAKLQAYGPIEGLHFIGALYGDALNSYLSHAFALIHPFGLGLTINSAFGHGCPVICCRDPDVHMPEFWVWHEHHNGIGFSPEGDDRQLSLALSDSLMAVDRLDQPGYAAMSQSATQAVHGMTTHHMTKRVLHLFKRVLMRHPPHVSDSVLSKAALKTHS